MTGECTSGPARVNGWVGLVYVGVVFCFDSPYVWRRQDNCLLALTELCLYSYPTNSIKHVALDPGHLDARKFTMSVRET